MRAPILCPFFVFLRVASWILLFLLAPVARAETYPDRLVWVFGWNLSKDSDVTEIDKLLETAAAHHINGAVLSAGLDSLTLKTPDYFRRLDQVAATCDRLKIELIPAIFSVGYGSPALSFDKMLAEGLPVIDAPFEVHGDTASFVPDDKPLIPNGGFEDFKGNAFRSFNFHDQPGTVSFVDTDVKHGGRASIRLQNFTANPHGHGRVSVKVPVTPHRCYRLTLWVKTQDLKPSGQFQVMALAKGDRPIAPRTYRIPSTIDWRKVTTVVNSLDEREITLYAGIWGGKSGQLWLDDWSFEEIGPVNVLNRPGTPVTVRSDDGATTYEEGRDYSKVIDPDFTLRSFDHRPTVIGIVPGSRIQPGQRLRVSWYHPMLIHDSQITVCMAEPKLYEILDQQAKALSEHLRPRRILLNMDEIRMGGTCKACEGKDMAQLLGQCITREQEILRKHIPGVQTLIWSDMLDPNHNARDNYYLVKGSFAGSWNHIPRDMTIAIWGGEPAPKSLKFFADQGFPTLAACYYDADNLDDVKGWLNAARPFKNVRGFMYTPWEKRYALLPAFGDLIQEAGAKP